MNWPNDLFPVESVREIPDSSKHIFCITAQPVDDEQRLSELLAETFDTVCRHSRSVELSIIDLRPLETSLSLAEGHKKSDEIHHRDESLARTIVHAIVSHLRTERVVGILTTRRDLNIAIRNVVIDVRRNRRFETCYFLWVQNENEIDSLCDEFLFRYKPRIENRAPSKSIEQQPRTTASAISVLFVIFFAFFLSDLIRLLFSNNGSAISTELSIITKLLIFALVAAGGALLLFRIGMGNSPPQSEVNLGPIARGLEQKFSSIR